MKIKLLFLFSMCALTANSNLNSCAKKTQSKCTALTAAICYAAKYTLYHGVCVIKNVHPFVLAQHGDLLTLQMQNDLGKCTDSLDKYRVAYVEGHNAWYMTPLHQAVTHGHPACVTWFLEKGADKSKKTYTMYSDLQNDCVFDSSLITDQHSHKNFKESCKEKKESEKKKEKTFFQSALELASERVKDIEAQIKECLQTKEERLKTYYAEKLENAKAIQKILQ